MNAHTTHHDLFRPLSGCVFADAGTMSFGFFGGCSELVGSSFSYAADEEIFGEDEHADYVYRIVSGAVRTCRILADGRRQIIGFHMPGEVFGCAATEHHRTSAEAITDTRVLVFERSQLERLASHNVEAACRLWAMTARDLEQAEEHVLTLGRRSAVERVGAFLLDLDDRAGVAGTIDLPMTRRDIADYLGLTLETVSRSLSQLQSDGALVLSDARRIALHRRVLSRMLQT